MVQSFGASYFCVYILPVSGLYFEQVGNNTLPSKKAKLFIEKCILTGGGRMGIIWGSWGI